MKQVILDVRSGATRVEEIPAPLASPGHIVVAAMASVISAGTERYVVDLARKSLIGKARQRPEDVKRIFQKLRQEGIVTTITQVFAKLDDPMPLGYSVAGIALECGTGVQEFKPGDRIAAAAPHCAISVVGRNLCALMPENVSFEQGAYTSIAAIGLLRCPAGSGRTWRISACRRSRADRPDLRLPAKGSRLPRVRY